jgi:zinc transporter ZupT
LKSGIVASSTNLLALLAAVIGVLSAVVGVRSLGGTARASRRVVPFSGGLLMGIAIFGVLPELASRYGRLGGCTLLAAGIGLLWVIGRYVYPVCPSCSHTHQHELCSTALHGFAAPLVAAASLHAFLDGLGIAASREQNQEGLAITVVLAVVLHKIPEGVALGVMLRAALRTPASALTWCAVVESATFFGAVFEGLIAMRAGAGWVTYALALAGGSFVYLGFHAVHGEWRRRGAPAFMPALTGAAGAAALQQGLRVFFH